MKGFIQTTPFWVLKITNLLLYFWRTYPVISHEKYRHQGKYHKCLQQKKTTLGFKIHRVCSKAQLIMYQYIIGNMDLHEEFWLQNATQRKYKQWNKLSQQLTSCLHQFFKISLMSFCFWGLRFVKKYSFQLGSVGVSTGTLLIGEAAWDSLFYRIFSLILTLSHTSFIFLL